MHLQRIEIIQHVFQTFPATNIVVHAFSSAKTEVNFIDLSIFNAAEVCKINSARRGHEWIAAQIHHGHLSVSKKFLSERSFEEDFNGAEDSRFVNAAAGQNECENETAVIFINQSLTLNYLARSLKGNL